MLCEVCNFETSITTNFRRHLESQAHFVKSHDNLICSKCLKQFKKLCGFSKHIKTCKTQLAPSQKNLYEQMQITNQPASIQNIQNINNGTIIHNYYMSIPALMNDKFTDSNHKLILHQMNIEKSDVLDYLPSIDQLIENDKNIHDQIQQENIEDGALRAVPFSLKILKFFHYTVRALTESTMNITITHRDLSVDGDCKLLLFKHQNNLHEDTIIRKIAKLSKFKEIIDDDGCKLPEFPEQYRGFIKAMYAKAFSRKNRHNSQASIQSARNR